MIKWCMEMYHNLYKVITNYMSMTYPRMYKQDAWLEMLEENLEILDEWFNDLRVEESISPLATRHVIMP